MTLRYLFYMIGSVVVAIVLIIWLFGNVPQSTFIYALNFIYPMPAVGFFTRATAYWRWQKRNKTVIYAQSGVFLGKIYPYPPLTKVGPNQPVVN